MRSRAWEMELKLTVLSCESQERPGSLSFSVTPQGEAQQQVSPDRSTLCG